MSVDKYRDIINLPHHQSEVHPRMSMSSRAAQFSPFAALTGYEGVIQETGRLTDSKIQLADDERLTLDKTLSKILERSAIETVKLTVVYFSKDSRKEGGEYRTVSSTLKKVDQYQRLLVLGNGESIPLDDIVQLSEDSEV
ncbi:MAG: hypothetical protein MJZ16_09645 [Bacteroidales bacterium]|nr:hypothetical protein [Bacteroidales bacterium]